VPAIPLSQIPSRLIECEEINRDYYDRVEDPEIKEWLEMFDEIAPVISKYEIWVVKGGEYPRMRDRYGRNVREQWIRIRDGNGDEGWDVGSLVAVADYVSTLTIFLLYILRYVPRFYAENTAL